MIIYNAGSGIGHMGPLASGHTLGVGTSTTVDLNFVLTRIAITSNTTTITNLLPWDPVLSGWAHFEYYDTSGNVFGTGRTMATLRSDSLTGGGFFRIIALNGTEYAAQYWDGAAWVSIGTWGIQTGRRAYDLHWDIEAGVFEVYQTKTLVAALSGVDLSHIPPIATLGFANPMNNQVHFSQFLVADSPTLFAKVKQTVPNAAGTHQEWTGALANINEAVDSTATSITANAANLRATYKAAARDFNGYGVAAVIPMVRAARGGSEAPPKIAPMLRIGGADYEGDPIDLSYGISWSAPVLYNNPATGSPWTATSAGDADLEFGVKSVGE